MADFQNWQIFQKGVRQLVSLLADEDFTFIGGQMAGLDRVVEEERQLEHRDQEAQAIRDLTYYSTDVHN